MTTKDLTNVERAHFRRMVDECCDLEGWNRYRITKALGYAPPGPIYAYMTDHAMGPSREKYDAMVRLHASLCSPPPAAATNGTLETVELILDRIRGLEHLVGAVQRQDRTTALLGSVLEATGVRLEAERQLLSRLIA